MVVLGLVAYQTKVLFGVLLLGVYALGHVLLLFLAGTFSGFAGAYLQGRGARAGQWLQTLAAGATREASIQAYVSRIAHSSPDIAAPWAEALADPNQRNSQIENVARQWLQTDRPAAEAWLAKLNLPDDLKKRLLSRP